MTSLEMRTSYGNARHGMTRDQSALRLDSERTPIHNLSGPIHGSIYRLLQQPLVMMCSTKPFSSPIRGILSRQLGLAGVRDAGSTPVL
jgi:hypothetical protein